MPTAKAQLYPPAHSPGLQNTVEFPAPPMDVETFLRGCMDVGWETHISYYPESDIAPQGHVRLSQRQALPGLQRFQFRVINSPTVAEAIAGINERPWIDPQSGCVAKGQSWAVFADGLLDAVRTAEDTVAAVAYSRLEPSGD